MSLCCVLHVGAHVPVIGVGVTGEWRAGGNGCGKNLTGVEGGTHGGSEEEPGKNVVERPHQGTWCSGITSASHAEGPGFKSQCVHEYARV